jgi:phosphocarrier protein HPr
MRQEAFVVRSGLGLTARGAAIFVSTIKASKSEVWVEKDGERRDGKNVLDLLMLSVPPGSKIAVIVKGEDEDAVMQQISELMESDLFVGQH